MFRSPVGVQLPLPGSYSSALVAGLPLLSSPAATSTMPLDSNVAVCRVRATLRLPVRVQLPLAGSYSSVLARMLLVLSNPPVTSTLPLGSSVAVYSNRPVLRLPVRVQLPPSFFDGASTFEVLLLVTRWPRCPN